MLYILKLQEGNVVFDYCEFDGPIDVEAWYKDWRGQQELWRTWNDCPKANRPFDKAELTKRLHQMFIEYIQQSQYAFRLVKTYNFDLPKG